MSRLQRRKPDAHWPFQARNKITFNELVRFLIFARCAGMHPPNSETGSGPSSLPGSPSKSGAITGSSRFPVWRRAERRARGGRVLSGALLSGVRGFLWRGGQGQPLWALPASRVQVARSADSVTACPVGEASFRVSGCPSTSPRPRPGRRREALFRQWDDGDPRRPRGRRPTLLYAVVLFTNKPAFARSRCGNCECADTKLTRYKVSAHELCQQQRHRSGVTSEPRVGL